MEHLVSVSLLPEPMQQPGGVRTLIEPVFQMGKLRHRVAQLVSGRARIRTRISWVLPAQRGRAGWLDPGPPAWASSLPWVIRMSYLPCVGRRQASNSPTPGLSFPFDEMTAMVPGSHSRSLGSAQRSAWAPASSLGQRLGPFLPHLRVNTLRPSALPQQPHPALHRGRGEQSPLPEGRVPGEMVSSCKGNVPKME